MKKILFVFIALSCGFVASAQVSDTVVVRRPDQVVIIKSQDAQSITVRGSEDDPDFVYKSSVGIGSSSISPWWRIVRISCIRICLMCFLQGLRDLRSRQGSGIEASSIMAMRIILCLVLPAAIRRRKVFRFLRESSLTLM